MNFLFPTQQADDVRKDQIATERKTNLICREILYGVCPEISVAHVNL